MHKLVNLPSQKINAMALGIPGLSVIFVTQGAKDKLTTSELDGVLAHEQAHIDRYHSLIKISMLVGFKALTKALIKMSDEDTVRRETAEQRLNRHTSVNLAVIATRMAAFNIVSFFMEKQADSLAAKRGHRAGLANALKKLQPQVKKSHVVLGLLQGQYHQNIDKRIAILEQ